MSVKPNGGDRHAVPAPGLFSSLGDWFTYLRAEGFNVPVQVPWAIQRAQKAWGLSADEAMGRLIGYGLLVVHPGGVTVDIRATTQDLDTLVENLEAEEADR